MPRPLTDACAAVLPIVFVAMGKIGLLSPLAPRAELLLCAKHLLVAAMMAGVHPGLPRIGKDGGASAFGAGEVFRGVAKAKRRRHYPWLDPPFIGKSTSYPCPRRRTCCFAPNICLSLPWWLGFTRAAGNRQFSGFILSQLPAWAKKE